MSWISPRVIRGNRGDIASRFGILTALLQRNVDISGIFNSRPSHVPQSLRDRLLPYGPLYNFWPGAKGLAALRHARHVVWTGGLDLQDDSSLIKLLHTWLVFASYRLLGLRILLAHQGAGPLQTRTGRWLARRVLSCVTLVLARDEGTHRLLSGLMPAERLRLVADGIFLPGFPTRDDAQAPLEPIQALAGTDGRPVVGLNVRLWFHFTGSWVPYQFARARYLQRAEGQMSELLESFRAVIEHLRRRHDARIVLVSMYEPGVEPWEDDLVLLERLKNFFPDDDEVHVLRDDLAIEDLCRLFTQFELMIGTRLHSALIALRAGVPAVHVAYTLKGRDIYADLGLSDWIVDIGDFIRSPEQAIALVDAVQAEPARFDRVRATVEPLVARNEAALFGAVRDMEAG
ncbi:colanic acid biosynthesis protein [Bosea sp. LC85]|uniref:polysaccharide pyruvyl transferase family protein n=1 Tax=Bosea sp. LC85 TaxID=1502851 RepID=UPI0004E29A75|nr:polysaccharide pyruvyl transferase family protein [Bosea sp. LC85]KFC66798.1 colanic acid biosynthesis protein [Bosea sp. LC85]